MVVLSEVSMEGGLKVQKPSAEGVILRALAVVAMGAVHGVLSRVEVVRHAVCIGESRPCQAVRVGNLLSSVPLFLQSARHHNRPLGESDHPSRVVMAKSPAPFKKGLKQSSTPHIIRGICEAFKAVSQEIGDRLLDSLQFSFPTR